MTEVTTDELKADLEERKSENPLAYRNNKLEFKLTKAELRQINQSKNAKNNFKY